MFAVMDCGTTNTRIYIVNEQKQIVAQGDVKAGVRDTSITGSRDKLRNAILKLFYDILENNIIPKEQVAFIIASGMITSEIGLMEIPHLVTPVGLSDLSENIVKVSDPEVLPVHCPIYFVRGTKNRVPDGADATLLRDFDFMRGEEVQCMGIIERYPELKGKRFSIVALSSHTKIMPIDEQSRIMASGTSISGQFYELIVHSTNIGKSVIPVTGEESGGYTWQQMIDIACDCVWKAGLSRAMLMPRFLQVLLKTDSTERMTFLDAAIAADDMLLFKDMREKGYDSSVYILYGHKERCEMYTYLIKRYIGEDITVLSIDDKAEIAKLQVEGAIKVALHTIQQ